MNDSADSLRERNRRETTRRLSDAARRLTVERGLAGFTIEELCAEVGVSRRTFFNYFESKENAVFGAAVIDPRQEALEQSFLDGHGDLVDDFVALVTGRFAQFNPVEHAAAMFTVVEKEPRLLKAAFDLLGKNEQRDIDLVVGRMSVAASRSADVALRAHVLVHTVGALVRLSMERIIHGHSTEPFSALITERLAIARSTFAPSQKAD